MNRLQKKCFIVSAGTHLLLGIILLVGPAFLSSQSKSNDLPTLDAIPGKLIDEAFSNPGGAPKPPTVTPTPPAPPVTVPAPPPPTPPQPTHVHPVPAPQPVKTETLDPTLDAPKRHKIDISLTPVTHHTNRVSSSTNEQAREAAEQRRHDLAVAFRNAAGKVSGEVSSATTIDVRPGNGTGGGVGEAYANYGQVVKSIYERAWVPPEDASSDNPITVASVTIARDGNVLDSSIVKSSGDSSVDSSVKRTLDRVTFIAPFPEGAKDKQRTYKIKFDLNARRLHG